MLRPVVNGIVSFHEITENAPFDFALLCHVLIHQSQRNVLPEKSFACSDSHYGFLWGFDGWAWRLDCKCFIIPQSRQRRTGDVYEHRSRSNDRWSCRAVGWWTQAARTNESKSCERYLPVKENCYLRKIESWIRPFVCICMRLTKPTVGSRFTNRTTNSLNEPWAREFIQNSIPDQDTQSSWWWTAIRLDLLISFTGFSTQLIIIALLDRRKPCVIVFPFGASPLDKNPHGPGQNGNILIDGQKWCTL